MFVSRREAKVGEQRIVGGYSNFSIYYFKVETNMQRDIPLVHIINHDKDATMPLEIASLAALVRWHAWFLRNELGKIDEKSMSEAAPVPFLPVQGDLALSTQPLPILGNGEIDYPRRQGVLVHYILGCSPLAEYEYALQKLSNAAWLLQRLARAGEMRDFGLLYHYLLNGENASGIRHVADQS